MQKLIIDANNYITYDDNSFDTIVGVKAHKLFWDLSIIARCIIEYKDLTYSSELEQFTIVQLLKEVSNIGVNYYEKIER